MDNGVVRGTDVEKVRHLRRKPVCATAESPRDDGRRQLGRAGGRSFSRPRDKDRQFDLHGEEVGPVLKGGLACDLGFALVMLTTTDLMKTRL